MVSDIKKMKNNRRNYYRILHVQPDAPLEIIRASYRAMMGPLKMHPDMGGIMKLLPSSIKLGKC